MRGISRRELTRAAVWTGAALLLGACSEEAPDRRVHDGTGGGEDLEGGDGVVVIDARDPDHVVVVQDGRGDDRIVDDQEEIEVDERWEQHRRYRACPEEDDMACMAMPYGAPPSPDAFV